MLSTADNDYLTRIGPGTPMGRLLRAYWIPLLYVHELPEPDGPPMRIRLLGESLVAFRDSSNRVGLLDHRCPHRQASLFYGRNEEGGLRCLYHGWKFDVQGRCTDIPNEPNSERLREKICARSYLCREKNGIIWTYMGTDSPPPLPEIGWARVPTEQKTNLKYLRECNWAQAMEGDFDSSHLALLHLAFDPSLQETRHERKWGTDYYRNLTRMAKTTKLDVVDTPVGVVYGARRETEEAREYWRVTQFQLPFYTSVPAYLGLNRLKIWVPMDDEHTMVWEANWNMHETLSTEQRRGWKNRVGPSGFQPETSGWYGRGRFAANRDNDYLQDRERQRKVNFTGMENVTPVQDGAMQESMGPIVDRSGEHLAASDAAIIRMRKCLLKAARALESHQEPPPGAFEPELYFAHGDQMLLDPGTDWRTEYRTRMEEYYRAWLGSDDAASLSHGRPAGD